MRPSSCLAVLLICSCAQLGAYAKKYIYISKKTESGITWHGFSSSSSPANGYQQITGLNAAHGEVSYFAGFSYPRKIGGCEFNVPLYIMRGQTRTPSSMTWQPFTILKQDEVFTGFSVVGTVYVANDDYYCPGLPGVRAIHYRSCAKIIVQGHHEAMYGLAGTVRGNCGLHYTHGAAVDRVYAYTGKLLCPDLPPFNHGVRQRTMDGDVRVKQYTFQCNSGYVLRGGQPRMVCNDGGRWNRPSQPRCTLADCGKPPIPNHGESYGTASTSYGARVYFRCNTGYKLHGPDSASCKVSGGNGYWDYGQRNLPTCHALDCGRPQTPDNGETPQAQTTTYGSKATFQCKPGFYLRGSSSATCSANGYHGYWDYGQEGTPTCETIGCPELQYPSNGRYLESSRSLGSKRTVRCDSGYELSSGDSVRTCELHQNEARWSGRAPTCTLITCSAPTAPENGKVEGTATSYGSEVRYKCNEGYRLQGADKSTCLAGGWQPEVPKCTGMQCPDLGVPANGMRTGDSNLVGAVVTFTCKTGYNLDGEASSTCGADGRWSSTPPECIAVECPSLLVPRYGTRDGDQVTFGSSAQFSCFGGYLLEGEAVTTCQADKTWSNPVPTCKACPVGTYRSSGGTNECKQCPRRTTTLTEASPGRQSCTCVEGTSGPAGGPCTVIKCQALTSPTHGSLSAGCQQTALDSECEVTCNPGYVLTAGLAIRKCTSDGWTGSEAKCSACPENTYTMHAGATSCIPCPKNMIKNPGEPGPCRCAPGFLKVPGGPCLDIDECMIKNGGCNQTCENSDGSYSCKCHIPGYTLDEDGKGCTLNQSCPVLNQLPSNGNLTCKYTEGSNGHICHISCNEGYFFVSGVNDYVVCGSDTGFEWSHRLVNKTARVPACTREFFVDVELPVRLKYAHSCGTAYLDVNATTTRLQQAVNTLLSLKNRVNDVKISCPPGQKEAEVAYDVTLKNPNSDEVPFDCKEDCQQSNMRSMVTQTMLFTRKVQTEVTSKPETFQLPVLGSPSSFKHGRIRLICGEGKVFTSNRLCVPCDRGYYLPSPDLETCLACPKGQFQDELGQTECKSCLRGSTTLSKGSDHPTMCSQKVQVLNAPDDTL